MSNRHGKSIELQNPRSTQSEILPKMVGKNNLLSNPFDKLKPNRYVKLKTKTQNNIVIFGFFHKKNMFLFLKQFDQNKTDVGKNSTF